MYTGDSPMVESGTGWPLSDEQRTRVRSLGELVRRHGSARLLRGHVVRADATDFPDAWEPTLAAIHRLLYRLLWHAHLDLEVVVEDARARAPRGRRMLTSSAIDLLEVRDGCATFLISAIGNDNVAGLACHAIGEAFLAQGPADPFREAAADVSATEASIAACYLGLGVLVANASMYRRYTAAIRGREVVSEQRVETTGGLSIGDATLLLAVQLIVRDDVPDARETLLPPQAEWVERWLEVLDPHEDELRSWLGLDDDAASELPSRPVEPRVPASIPEPALVKINAGRVSFRVPRRRHRVGLGLLIGVVAGFACAVIDKTGLWLLLIPAGGFGGFLVNRPGFACFSCRHTSDRELDTCPGCGIALPETLATKAQRTQRLLDWAARAEAADPETRRRSRGRIQRRGLISWGSTFAGAAGA